MKTATENHIVTTAYIDTCPWRTHNLGTLTVLDSVNNKKAEVQIRVGNEGDKTVLRIEDLRTGKIKCMNLRFH